MESTNIFNEIPSAAYNSVATTSDEDTTKPMDTVVIASGDKNLLVIKDGKNFLQNLKSGARYILKTDAYIDDNSTMPKDVEFVLDGGNLYRIKTKKDIPRKITCVNGAFIDDGTIQDGGSSMTHIVGARENTSVKNFHNQTNYVVEYNMMDFVHSDDYKLVNSEKAINLRAVINRIFNSLYNANKYQCQKMAIKMPETYFGSKNFFMDEPIVIKHNVILDLSGAVVYVAENFNPGTASNKFGDKYVFSFETNTVHPNLATSVVKNAEIVLDKNLGAAKCPHVIFNLKNFSGIMENVKINLNYKLGCVALWQPFGTPTETYSDKKIIRRCKVSNAGWRTETPSVLFCKGDGCIIEQCELGYVAIISGKSYTIRGCLNDSYFLYDSTVDFTGSYWEIGQFQILDSKVRFATCRLDCQNNHLDIIHPENQRRYIGPWMAVDTDGCRERLKNMLNKLNLGEINFNDIKAVSLSDPNYNKYKAHITSQFSTVSFDPTIRSQHEYWGYRQPMSDQLLKVGDRAQILGLENLGSIPTTYIHNTVNKGRFEDSKSSDVEVEIVNRATIPLVNGDFFDLKKDIEIPTTVEITNKTGNPNASITKELGCDWVNETFQNFEVRLLLDRKRQLYSKAFSLKDAIVATKDKEFIVTVNVDMTNTVYSNLMVELSFKRTVGNKSYWYTMRQHFSRSVEADMLSYGNYKVKPAKRGDVEIAKFTISKVDLDTVNKVLKQQYVEEPTVKTDITTPIANTLSDYCGNMYKPSTAKSLYPNYTASKLQHIGNNNVRAYVTAKPEIVHWNEGDQIVIPSSTGSNLYILLNMEWHKLY